jgi:hypothetical protein
MKSLRVVPLLVFPALAYVALWLSSGGRVQERLAGQVFRLPMASGDVWQLSLGGVFVIAAVVCLFLEVVRSAIPSGTNIAENMVTAIVLVISIGAFLLLRGFGTTEFFLIVLLLLLDFLTDSTVMVLTARRTVDFNR